MKYIKEQLAKFKKRFNIKLSDTAISLLGIGILIVVLIGGMVLYNASQKQPLFSFFGRDIFGEDVFDVFDDDEDDEDKDKDKDKNTEDKNQEQEKEEEKEEESSSSSNEDIQFKEEDNKTDNKQENNGGGLTPSEDDKDSNGGNDKENEQEKWSSFW